MYKGLNIKISQMMLFYLRFNEIVKSTLMIIGALLLANGCINTIIKSFLNISNVCLKR